MTCFRISLALAARLGFAVLLVAGLADGAAAQSVLASRGLGLVIEPRSARSSALGGVSLGLPGSEISWANPAGAVGLPAGGLTASFQFDDLSTDYRGDHASTTIARFPLVLAAFPFGSRWAVTAGLGGYLDQNWTFQRRDSLVVEGDTLQFIDRVASDGGVARLRFGAAYRLVPRLSVGLGLDVYTGGVQRTDGRIFAPAAAPQCCQRRWDYSGVGLVGSVDWNPTDALSLSVGGSAGGTLDADPRDSTAAAFSSSLPASLDAGASARLAPSLLVAAGGRWTGWSRVDDDLGDAGGARDAWSLQGGLEWDALRVGARAIPLRLGGRTATLPFGPAAGDEGGRWTRERALTGGTGLTLGSGAVSADVGVERGSRSGESGVDESYWRFLLSVSVLGQ
jgi:hypothetical protein